MSVGFRPTECTARFVFLRGARLSLPGRRFSTGVAVDTRDSALGTARQKRAGVRTGEMMHTFSVKLMPIALERPIFENVPSIAPRSVIVFYFYFPISFKKYARLTLSLFSPVRPCNYAQVVDSITRLFVDVTLNKSSKAFQVRSSLEVSRFCLLDGCFWGPF